MLSLNNLNFQVPSRSARSGSAPPGGLSCWQPVPISPGRNREPDVDLMSAEQIRLTLQGVDRRLIRAIYAAFRFCPERNQMLEHLEIGGLGDEDLRRAVVLASTRGWRFDTLVRMILKGQFL